MNMAIEANGISLDPNTVPRAEYPRPQFVRDAWQTLNGVWGFRFDDDNQGLKEHWFEQVEAWADRIVVPYTYQSKLSGIGTNKFHDIVWYNRTFSIGGDRANGHRVILHFGAVDYLSHVWVNGRLVGSHEGGHASFSFDITDFVGPNENTFIVRAEDPSKRLDQPRGKQYWEEQSARIFYTRTTGIWQSVWLEYVPQTHLKGVKFTPDIDAGEVCIDFHVTDVSDAQPIDWTLKIDVHLNDIHVHETFPVTSSVQRRKLPIRVAHRHEQEYLWSPEHPNLFDVTFQLVNHQGQVVDEVTSYFGMRKISVENGKVFLNNRPYYMRLVLDQGYFPDGILTAPTDEALKGDVALTKALGFNGARKHQKVEDPRYLYWCDQMGLLVWGEMANSYAYSVDSVRRITQEWQEVIERDYNHPCIVVWVPVNESWGVPNLLTSEAQRAHTASLYYLTKSLDSTRPVVSNDGWEHTISDLVTIHDYESQKSVLKERYATVERAVHSTPSSRLIFAPGSEYRGEPILVTEFGGISFKKSEWDGWGYSGADSDEDFIHRYAAVVESILESPTIQGFCYTQLTDVEQEINGVLTYDRQPKVPVEIIRDINLGRYKR